MANDLNASPDPAAMVVAMGENARVASRVLARAGTATKNRALEAAAEALVDREKTILAANAHDVKDARALCLKSGNACILRGGSEALKSNQAIAACLAAGLKNAGLPADCIQLVDTPDRAVVGELVRLEKYVDAVVPRGARA